MKKYNMFYITVLVIISIIPAIIFKVVNITTNTDTMKFVKTMTSISHQNVGLNFKVFGGYLKDEQNTADIQNFLKDSINNKEELLEAINSFYKKGNISGYSVEFSEMYQHYLNNTEDWQLYETSLKTEAPDEFSTITQVFEEYKVAFTDEWLTAYDLTIAATYASWGYIADYLTFEESSQLCFDIATELQSKFTSWEEYQNNYIIANEYIYSFSTEELASIKQEFEGMFSIIKNDSTKLFEVPFNTPLVLSDLTKNQVNASSEATDPLSLLIFLSGFALILLFIVFSIIGGIIFSICEKSKTKLLDKDGYTHYFSGSNIGLWIDVEKNKIWILAKYNPFDLQEIDPKEIESAKTEDGKGFTGGTCIVQIVAVIGNTTLKIPTFTSRRLKSMESEVVLTAISKADKYVEALLKVKDLATSIY